MGITFGNMIKVMFNHDKINKKFNFELQITQ